MRTAGPAISPYNAWTCLKGMETLGVRMRGHCANALELARWLESHPGVERVIYPGLASHPQHALAMKQQSAGGALLSFVVKGGRSGDFRDDLDEASRTAASGSHAVAVLRLLNSPHASCMKAGPR